MLLFEGLMLFFQFVDGLLIGCALTLQDHDFIFMLLNLGVFLLVDAVYRTHVLKLLLVELRFVIR